MRREWMAAVMISAAMGGCYGQGDDPAQATDAVISATEQSFINTVNARRAQGVFCGTSSVPAVAQLSAPVKVDAASERHANDMALHDFYSPVGSDGSTVSARLTDEGYAVRNATQLYVGVSGDPSRASYELFRNTASCQQLMSSTYRHIGVAYVAANGKHYWSVVLSRAL